MNGTGSNRLFSIVVPVYNETVRIRETVSHLLSQPSPRPIEVIVVDGNPSGNTIAALKGANVRTILSKKGRGAQMNAGARIARGNILVFLHADTRLPESGLKDIENILKNRRISAGAFDLSIRSAKPAFRLVETVANFRTRVTRIPYGDQAHFIRKSLFRQLRGYKDIPIMEDVELMCRVKRAGHRIQIARTRVCTSARRWEKEGLVYCTLRNWALIASFSIGISPDKLSRFYRTRQ